MKLKLVHPTSSSANVSVEIRRERDLLVADFQVRDAGARHLNPAFPLDSSANGLWDWDVVELFVRANSSPTYYEFQVSPLGQFFELEVLEPRKKTNAAFRSGFSRTVTLLGDHDWNAQLKIPLAKLGWDGRWESVVGNAFAILGSPERKTYWSLFLPPQQKPDFHLPRFFKPLV